MGAAAWNHRLSWSLLLGMLCLLGCTEREGLQIAQPDDQATVHRIWAAKFRSDLQADRRGAPPRPTAVAYEAIDVSVPPVHRVGQIEWPSGSADAAQHFVTLSQAGVPNLARLAADVRRSDTSGLNETFVFVHGYNMRHAEAVYQITQFTHDFDVPTPRVLFSWPSAGVLAGYVHDRDSALISRNALEELLMALSNDGRQVMLVTHSMGGYLAMETLRQMSLKGTNVYDRINGVIMISPDIDGDLFRKQANDVARLPDPFVLMVAEQDTALWASSLLTGRLARLGNRTDRSIVGDLPVTIVDVSRLAGANDSTHSIAISSPTAISVLKEVAGATPPGEAALPDVIVLAPDS
ncbi:MAG: alpha/beta fold hydrolase [Pseudomonadota bacterium]